MMSQASLVQEHMDVISSGRKMVGKVDHLDGPAEARLRRPVAIKKSPVPRAELR
jgi:hypothetical protein